MAVTENGLTYKKVAVSQSGIEFASFVVNQTDKSTYDIKLSMMMQELIIGKLVVDGDNYKLNLSAPEDSETSFNLSLSVSGNSGTLEIESDSSKVKVDFTCEEVSEYPNIDLSNSAPSTEMTEEEKEYVNGLFGSLNFGPSLIENNDSEDDFEFEFNYGYDLDF